MIDHPPPEMAMCGFLSPPGLNLSAMHQIFHLPVSKSLHFLGIYTPLGFPDGASGKEPACQCRRHKRLEFHPWVGKIPWRRAWQPLQCSCLENPMDRRAWWATGHRVVKTLIQLKQLSMHTQGGESGFPSPPRGKKTILGRASRAYQLP